MYFIDNINLVLAGLGREEDLILDLSDVIDACIACTINFNNINAVPLGDLTTVGAEATRSGGRPLFTVQALANIRADEVFPTPLGPLNR